ncbi:MAG: phage holin family protein [Candidatus Nealsonbacteria bacterium]|nr:phage holin family protein [Candidatus Nealsonbacteria bacterium]
MRNFILKTLAGLAGLWLAIQFVDGVSFYGSWQDLLVAGLILGGLNAFVKPILTAVTLPLRILTLGIFSLIINMGIVWAVDIFFPELIITGILPLLWTTLIIWAIGFVLPNVKR